MFRKKTENQQAGFRCFAGDRLTTWSWQWTLPPLHALQFKQVCVRAACRQVKREFSEFPV
jgi:hypothetical protein